MAVPKKKSSPMCQGMRWSHIKARTWSMATCSNCQNACLPHHVCTSCGYYKGKQVLAVRSKKIQEDTE